MATAPASKTDGISASGTPIRVITPDRDGHFQLKIAKGDVAKIQIVDVDMVLVLKDGTRMVLAGGALGAMDADVRVQFSNGPDTAARLLEQVGKIELQKFDHPQVLNSEPVHPGVAEEERSGPRDMETAHDLASQAQAANATLAAISQALAQLASVVQQNARPVNEFTSDEQDVAPKQPLVRHEVLLPPERPGKTPQEIVIGPDAPAMEIHLVNLTGTRQAGSVLQGSGGSSEFNSSVNTSNAAQFAPQIIRAGNDVRTIYATGKAPTAGNTPDGTFVKVLDVQISGDGKVQSLVISGVPADMSIVGATALGGGAYAISVSPDTKDYPIQLQYNTVAANPGAPIHADFKLTFSLAVITTEGVQTLTSVKQVVLKDVSSESDLSYANPVTGESVFVLPAQGISHIVHAGDNAGVTVYGSNANDFLYGGSGNDTLYGGFGNTYFEGGAGNDTIVGGLNAGGSNTNTVGYATSPNGVTVDLYNGKALDGFGGTDTLINIHSVIGSSGSDTFIVGPTTRSVDGGAGGSDTLDFSHSGAAVAIDLKNGTGSGGYAQNLAFTHIDNVVGTSFDDTFIAGSTANRFDGGAGGSNTVSYAGSASGGNGKGVTVNLLTGQGQGADAEGDRYVGIQNVIGSAYDDVFVGNGDVNHFDGGNGNDTVSYAGSAAGVTVDFYNGRGFGGNAEGDTYRNIENAIGSAHDDRFVVDTSTSRHFDGGSGGFDTVSYERSLSGVTIDAARNVGGLVTGSVGGLPSYSNSYTNIDRFVGSNYADLFIASSHADHFDGLDGNDTVSYAADTAGVTIDLVDGTGTGGLAQGDTLVNIENIIGGSGNDTFVANDKANVFDGGSGGSNTVDYSKSTTGGVIVDLFHGDGVGTSGGFAQGDRFVNIQNVIGTAYDDVFVASADANRFDGGIGGRNRVSYANDTAGVTVDLDANAGSGGLAAGDTYRNIQDVTGGSGDDTFVASSEANHFDGGAGSNTVSYAKSGDGVTVDLFAGTGAGGHAAGDTFVNVQNVIGSTQDDLFYASGVANSFTGNGGDDTVSYERANDGEGVTVDLAAGRGYHGFAEGDRYDGIRNVIGTAYDDLFISGGLQAHTFTGNGGSDTVSYAASTAGVIVNFSGTTLEGVDGGRGGNGYAQGDAYIGIDNAIGSDHDDVFIAGASANGFDGGGGTNRVSYAASGAGVIVNLSEQQIAVGAETIAAGSGRNGFAEGDRYANIQNVTGSAYDDVFVASEQANAFDGGDGVNTVHYGASDEGVTVNLSGRTQGTLASMQGSGGYAQGDSYARIQNVVGSAFDDVFYGGAGANRFEGNGGRDRVSYAGETADLTIDLAAGSGTGGTAEGDIYIGIRDATGGSGNDTFIASAAVNDFDGGGGSNTVSYAAVDNGIGVVVDLNAQRGGGVAQSWSADDTYVNVQNVIGSAHDDTFIASDVANVFTGNGGSDTVSYAASADGVIVNLSSDTLEGTAGGRGRNGYADGDTYIGISNVIGGMGNDVFVANGQVNRFDGGAAGTTNRVSYAASGAGVIVNLSDRQVAVDSVTVDAGRGRNGYAEGDSYLNIQDATGGGGNDVFIASAQANAFDGGGGSNTVHYGASNVGVTVNLAGIALHGVDSLRGSGGYANGDRYTNIQNVVGSAFDDVFYASADTSAPGNRFDGGISTDASHNRVSYEASTAGVTVNLATGVGSDGAAGDTYVNIQDVTGGSGNDTFVASAAANRLDGGAGNNTVSYAASNAGVTVNLSDKQVVLDSVTVEAESGKGGHAEGDEYANIQNVIGSVHDDLFIAGNVANNFRGNGGSDTVSYAVSDTSVTVDLFNGVGSGGYANGDTYIGISNVIGGKGNDVFIANAVANRFDGGAAGTINRVSYGSSDMDVVVNLSDMQVTVNSVTVNAGRGKGGLAEGDTYVNIQNVTGGSGNDVFIASAQANAFDGGIGSNTVHYGASNVGVIVNLSGVEQDGVAAMSGSGGYAQGDSYANIQNVTGSAFDDLFYGGDVANAFVGNGGRDRVSYALDTADLIINFSAGSVTVGGTTVGAGRGARGNAQDDRYSGIQDATGGAGNDTFIASAAANAFDGGGGSNTVSYVNSAGGVKVNLADVDVDGVAKRSGSNSHAEGDTYANIQNVVGSAYSDTLIGASSGMTVLTGGAGGDRLIGIAANSGNTYANYAGSNAGVIIDLVNGVGTGGHAQGDTLSNIDNLIGSSYDDTFIANDRANILNGGAGGSDTVSYERSGGAVRVNLSNDAAEGIAARSGAGGYAAGDTYISIENAIGSAYDDVLIGATNGRTELRGGAGADTLIGIESNRGNTYASYAGSNAGVTIDLVNGVGTGGHAQGDTLEFINNLIGSSYDDLFIANEVANSFTGGGGNDTVSYQYSTAGVNVNLSTADLWVGGLGTTIHAQTGNGGYAAGDSYDGIRNVIGSAYNDLFIAGSSVNHFDGGDGNNTVSYAANWQGVTVNLSATEAYGVAASSGSGGWAGGDTYANIQNVTGSSNGNDTFIASDVANVFNGNGGNSNTVSYLTTAGDVHASLASGTGGTGGADIDTYINIHNLTGSAINGHNTLIGNTGNNVLTARGADTVNLLEGGGGNDTFDAIQGRANTLIGGSGNDTFKITANTSGSNITTTNAVSIVGNGGNDTLEVHGTGTTLDVSAFAGVVSYGSIATLDLSNGAWSLIKFSYSDLLASGPASGSGIGIDGQNGNPYLTIRLKDGQGIQIDPSEGSDSFAYFGGTSDYVFYDNNAEVARVHLTYA